MTSPRIFEAQRLLRRANEINPDAAALAIKAMQELSAANILSKHALYYIYQAFPTGEVQENILTTCNERHL